MNDPETLERLIHLSRNLGREDRGWALLGEGNTSAANGDGTFWVKASGSRMETIEAGDFTKMRAADVLTLLDRGELDNDAVNRELEALRVDPSHKRPSVETFMHALCLTEGEAGWVGHTHTPSVLGILCSKLGAEPFRQHVYPDEIVVCGRHIAVVPYVDPGLPLACAVRDELRLYKKAHGHGPKLMMMVNHGPVALGDSDREVLNILLMADKWARIILGTFTMGGPWFLSNEEADRISGRPDEIYRRARL